MSRAAAVDDSDDDAIVLEHIPAPKLASHSSQTSTLPRISASWSSPLIVSVHALFFDDREHQCDHDYAGGESGVEQPRQHVHAPLVGDAYQAASSLKNSSHKSSSEATLPSHIPTSVIVVPERGVLASSTSLSQWNDVDVDVRRQAGCSMYARASRQ